MKTELFIAMRYFFAKRRLNFITIISYLSFAGITIGVAALIIVMSVYNGFSDLVSSMLITLDPHIKVESVSEAGQASLDSLPSKINSGIPAYNYSRFIQGKVLAFTRGYYRIVNLKGIDWNKCASVYKLGSYISVGKCPTTSTAFNDSIVIGAPLAIGFGLRPGDTLVLISPRGIESSYLTGGLPQMQKVVVAGLFESQHNEYDMSYIFCGLNSAQYLFGYSSSYQGLDLQLPDVYNSPRYTKILKATLDTNSVSIDSWFDLHEELFTVMKIERTAAFVLLSLIVLVAVFNILASLAMSVIEKRRDIGILQAMGLNSTSIKRIFFIQGIIAGTAGSILGFGLGLFIYWLQKTYKIYPLDPFKFKIDAMPMQLNILDFIIVAAAAIGLSALAAVLPARRAARINALEAIRWE